MVVHARMAKDPRVFLQDCGWESQAHAFFGVSCLCLRHQAHFQFYSVRYQLVPV